MSDCHRELATKYGIMAKDAASDSQTGRSVFLLEPEGHISAAFHYPLLFGRSTDDCITVTTGITRSLVLSPPCCCQAFKAIKDIQQIKDTAEDSGSKTKYPWIPQSRDYTPTIWKHDPKIQSPQSDSSPVIEVSHATQTGIGLTVCARGRNDCYVGRGFCHHF